MTRLQSEERESVLFDKSFYSGQVNKLIEAMMPQLIQTVRSYVFFSVLFFAAGLVEIILLLFLFTFLIHSSLLTFILAALFFTFFSYFIIRLYFLTKKPEQFHEFRDHYIAACSELIHYQEGIPEHHLARANACYLFAAALQGKEYHLYPPRWMGFAVHSMESFSHWWHWYDFHKMKELFLQASVNEHISLVKCSPTNLEAHVALANAYVMLSGLYVDPRKIEAGEDDDRRGPPKQFSEVLQQKFRLTAERAIEELKILSDYAPEDPWVHVQLAYSYHDLQMPREEIREYETILKLRPDDKDILFKLGVLYFQQGQNAQGLRVYEELRKTHYKKAESLIKFYGAYSF